MPRRPMTEEEREYLAEYRASLGEAWRGFWLTVALWGLPAGFLASSLTGGRSTERLALGLAVAILLALIGGIVSYSPQAARSRRLSLADLRLPNLLEQDMLAQDVEETTLRIEQKTMVGPRKREDGGAPRRYFIQAGGYRFEVTPLRWMNMSEGQELVLAFAPASGLLLEIEGMRERLPMPSARRSATPRDQDLPAGPT